MTYGSTHALLLISLSRDEGLISHLFEKVGELYLGFHRHVAGLAV
jgi:hypothetical protein